MALLVDPREITGAPAWMKPAKFAASIAIYTLTLAWVFTYLREWPRTRRVVSWVTTVTLLLEIVIIDLQAWRGTTSHFNVGTLLDGVLFTIMGLRHRRADARRHGCRGRAVAAAFADRATRMGASPRHDHHDRRRHDGRADDARRRARSWTTRGRATA